MPPNGPRLLQISDTHLFADPAAEQAGVVPELRLRATLRAMAPWAATADGLLHTGDLVHDGSPAGYQRLREALLALDLPGLVMPGNHDDRDQLQAAFATGPVTAARTLPLGEWTLIGLDSLQTGEVPGHLGEAELAALDRALADCTTAYCLVALHHPPFPVGTSWLDAIGLDNPAPLFQRLAADRRVRAVVCGHVHMAFDGRLNGFRTFATPATAAQFLAGAEAFATDRGPPGFRWFDLRADGGIDTGVVRVTGV
ncbi:phosphodiesterase [Spiribacter onubensis]|uniref:Phosphodiesterase n=1 Tax=Spiribacter onubensis TaxID=3122420 RepID=A0ABV3SAX5_9GAMM